MHIGGGNAHTGIFILGEHNFAFGHSFGNKFIDAVAGIQ